MSQPFPPGKTAKELGLKVGDEVVCVESDSSCNLKTDDICVLEKDGTVDGSSFRNKRTGETHCWYFYRFAPVDKTPTWENLKAGDKMWCKEGESCLVLARIGDVIIRSCWSDYCDNWDTEVSGAYHVEQLKRAGFLLSDPKTDTEKQKKIEEARKLLEDEGIITDGKIVK